MPDRRTVRQLCVQMWGQRRRLGWLVLVAAGVLAAVWQPLFGQPLFGQAPAREVPLGRQSVNRTVSPLTAPRDTPLSPASGKARVVPAEANAVPHALPQPVQAAEPQPNAAPGGWGGWIQPDQLVSPGGLSSTMNIMILMTVLSLAPSILIMTTCFIRFIIVLGLLRQALGTQQLPPNQVIIALCLFLTYMVMAPVWQQAYEQGIKPYTQPAAGEAPPSLELTFQRTALPVRRFMGEQIERTGNSDSVWLFLDYQRPDPNTTEGQNYKPPESYDEVPLSALLPAFMLSELKTSFIIGFQLYLPFLVIDMVVSAVLMSMGMMMLPPTLISFPFKLLLFVLIDGWYLTVGMMLDSVRPFH